MTEYRQKNKLHPKSKTVTDSSSKFLLINRYGGLKKHRVKAKNSKIEFTCRTADKIYQYSVLFPTTNALGLVP